VKNYKHLFFDLDGTLWDLYRNTEEALTILRDELSEKGIVIKDFKRFYQRYLHHNERVWALYRVGKIEKDVLRVIRFERSFQDVGLTVDAATIDWFADRFLDVCPKLPNLLPGTIELLDSLKGKYHMHIITNGFQEVQGFKMTAGNLNDYFIHIINSEDAGAKKPNPEIFEFALNKAGATIEESLMIGDDWDADIIGARNFGIDQVFLTYTEKVLFALNGKNEDATPRHNYKPTYTIDSLLELKEILKK
jgi:putative hydrolase of the HAD superfamily